MGLELYLNAHSQAKLPPLLFIKRIYERESKSVSYSELTADIFFLPYQSV